MQAISSLSIERLSELGLTPLQAKIYLLLYKIGKTEVRKLGTMANIDRANMYKILDELARRGLVERIFEVPKSYRPIPMQEAINFLLEQKEDEYKRLVATSKELLKEETEFEKKPVLSNMDNMRIIPYGNKTVEKELESEWANIRRTAYLYLEEVSFLEKKPTIASMWKKAMNRGVKIRVITAGLHRKPPDNIVVRSLKKYPNFEIKYISSPITCSFYCLDGKETGFTLKEKNSSERVKDLLIKREEVGELIQTYFEMLWGNLPPG